MSIEERLQEFTEIFLPKDFVWRIGQKEVILEIIQAYKNNVKTIILSAPTGSGKSVVGIAVSYILNEEENKHGFILSSDLSLQEQYERDFKRFNINYGSIKGINNYLCVDNNEKNSLGTCRIRNKAPKRMYCYSQCPYFSARDNAADSPTALLNYSYFLIHMNYVNQHMDEPIFEPRDFCICDEGHKILDIVQNHFSPRFDPKTIEKLEKIVYFFDTYKIRNHYKDFYEIKTNIGKLFDTENQEELLSLLSNIELSFEELTASWQVLKDKTSKEYPQEDPPKAWKDALRLCDWMKDLHCKVEDYVDIINVTSTRNIVKNPTGEDELTFNCLEESYMMQKYFHQWTGFTVLMSATFADPSDYMRSIALGKAKYIKMQSNFNFEKSPIYFYNKRRMSYAQIKENLPWLYAEIDKILDNHKNENGIIHTASYDLTKKIYDNLSKKNQKRILVYSGSEEKKKVLDVLKAGKNRVIMGPSLTHGLDLRDSWARFAIIAKVPYASLTDKFVATKMKIDNRWYKWKTIIDVLQSVGRTVRNENDWCETYILDACFGDLLHQSRKSFPDEFIARLQIVNE